MSLTIFNWQTDSTSIKALEQGIALALASNAKSLLILSCNQNNYSIADINRLLSTTPLPICGGIYPLLLKQQDVMEQGALIIGFDVELNIANFTEVSTIEGDSELESYINQACYQNTIAQQGLLMFYDCLTPGVENFLDTLFELLDHDIAIAGGGAGNLDFIQKPCVYSNLGLLSDCIQLVGMPEDLSIGVAHGWETFKGPFLVSEAHEQSVHSLNYLPAFDTYKQIIEEASNYRFDSTSFFDIAKRFPLGIEDINHELVVRDPVLTENNQLHCLGNIPVNSMVYLLKGDKNTLINSAKEATISSLRCNELISSLEPNSPANQKQISTTMVFDCISRVLYLQDHFSTEIAAIAKQCSHNNLFGVLSLGEIAKHNSGAIRLLNKSTVIASW